MVRSRALELPRDWSMSIEFDRATGFGWAGGYSGHSVAAANISARTLADLACGRDSDLTTLPWVGRRSPVLEPGSIRFRAARGIVGLLASADRREDATDRSAQRIRFVKPFLAPADA
jgi:hypothetical protein